MHDYGLGGPVDVGEYTGPRLDGKPLHKGACNDGVYGCTKCNYAARSLKPDQLQAIGFPVKGDCEWCGTTVEYGDLALFSSWDEPSVKSEVCSSCRIRNRRESDELADGYDYDSLDYESEE